MQLLSVTVSVSEHNLLLLSRVRIFAAMLVSGWKCVCYISDHHWTDVLSFILQE